ncbi:MAG: polysaccharide deacetylase family protein [Flavobacteriales bacterium]
MKKFFLFFLFSYSISFAQDIEITNWYNNKSCAVVMTFDDWLEGHEKIVVPALIEKKLPATFFVTLQGAQWKRNFFDEMRNAQAHGCEIANHTVTHPSLTSISSQKAKSEIDSARKIIMDSVPGAQCLTFAYPMGTRNNEVTAMVQKEHIGARSVNPFDERNIVYDFATDTMDYYRVNTVRVWHIVTLEKIAAWVDYAEKGGGMLTFMMHSIYNDKIAQGWDAMPEEFLKGMLDTLKSREDKVWITTFASALKYHQQKRATQVKFIGEKKGVKTYRLVSALNPEIYSQQLTLKMKKPSSDCDIHQGLKKIPYTISPDGLWIYFNVAPDKEIKIEIQ